MTPWFRFFFLCLSGLEEGLSGWVKQETGNGYFIQA
jgi:hypothetical protein